MLVCNSGVFTWCVRWGVTEGREGEGEEGAEKPRAPIHGVFKPAQMVKVLGPLGWRVGTGCQVGEAVMEWHIRAPALPQPPRVRKAWGSGLPRCLTLSQLCDFG